MLCDYFERKDEGTIRYPVRSWLSPDRCRNCPECRSAGKLPRWVKAHWHTSAARRSRENRGTPLGTSTTASGYPRKTRSRPARYSRRSWKAAGGETSRACSSMRGHQRSRRRAISMWRRRRHCGPRKNTEAATPQRLAFQPVAMVAPVDRRDDPVALGSASIQTRSSVSGANRSVKWTT